AVDFQSNAGGGVTSGGVISMVMVSWLLSTIVLGSPSNSCAPLPSSRSMYIFIDWPEPTFSVETCVESSSWCEPFLYVDHASHTLKKSPSVNTRSAVDSMWMTFGLAVWTCSQ